ncbi:ATP synthase regulation protein NCA2-domain-containing protein, partial [Mycena sp. CBHHK59/15]
MSRLRVNSHFADNFTRPLSLTSPSTPEHAPLSPLPLVFESTETLRSLLVSLKPPISQTAVDDALEYLDRADRNTLLATEDSQARALKDAVVAQVAVGLYAQSLDMYLDEATEIEAEAEWWANVERSYINVAWFLLQTFPTRVADVLHTVLDALREQRLPFRLSSFTPSSLFRLLPSTGLHPSALTSSFFPHLEHDRTFSSLLWSPSRPSSSRTVSQYLRSIWSTIFLPLNLAREECRYKRRKLEKLRDQRAEELGRLAQLRISAGSGPFDGRLPSQLLFCLSGELTSAQTDDVANIQRISSTLLPARIAAHVNATRPLCRPSRLVLLWPKLLLLPPLTIYTLRSLHASRASIMEMALEARETVEGFIKNSLVEPLKEILKTVRTGGEDGVIVRKEGVAADLDSLERMTLSLARDQLHYDSTQLAALSKQIRLGDLTPVLQLYEEDIKKPVKSALTGTLLRSMFIQVQKAKELTFAFVGLAPALVIVTLLGSNIPRLWRSSKQRRFGGRTGRADAWSAMRRIERLLVSQPRVTVAACDSLPALTTGLLLISVTRLRTYAETSLPRRTRLRAGFLQDVGDLEDPAMPREEKLRVVERMWRSWGGVLGWGEVAGEGI